MEQLGHAWSAWSCLTSRCDMLGPFAGPFFKDLTRLAGPPKNGHVSLLLRCLIRLQAVASDIYRDQVAAHVGPLHSAKAPGELSHIGLPQLLQFSKPNSVLDRPQPKPSRCASKPKPSAIGLTLMKSGSVMLRHTAMVILADLCSTCRLP